MPNFWQCADAPIINGWKAEFEAGALLRRRAAGCDRSAPIARAAHSWQSPVHRSAVFAFFDSALVLACWMGIALRSPAVIANFTSAVTVRDELVLISVARAGGNDEASVSVEEIPPDGLARSQEFFSDISFYRMERLIWDDGGQKTALTVGRGSANLFALLGLPMEIGSAKPSADPQLVLSDASGGGILPPIQHPRPTRSKLVPDLYVSRRCFRRLLATAGHCRSLADRTQRSIGGRAPGHAWHSSRLRLGVDAEQSRGYPRIRRQKRQPRSVSRFVR